jgi:hypothetical protein
MKKVTFSETVKNPSMEKTNVFKRNGRTTAQYLLLMERTDFGLQERN